MDDERRKKGSVGAAGAPAGHQGVVTQGVSAKVLNQGGHGTCVGYAVSLVMTTALHEIHGIACDPEKLVEKVKALCPCWEGHETERMLGQWNKKHAKPGAAIEDVDQRQRYNVMVQYTKITSFEEARAEMERQEALKLLMPCTISTGQQGHKLHAVALRGTAPGGKMEAVNSWGANQSLLEITPANFCYAIRFDPVITAAAKSGGVQIAIPPVRSMFSARVQEQDDKRKKAEQAKRDEVEKAGLLDAHGFDDEDEDWCDNSEVGDDVNAYFEGDDEEEALAEEIEEGEFDDFIVDDYAGRGSSRDWACRGLGLF